MTEHAHDSWRPASFDPRYEECEIVGCYVMRRAPVKLDIKEAKEKRDEAIQLVGTWADSEWVGQARLLGQRLAHDLAEFTSDEFWRRGLPKPREPRALGPVMTSLVRDGFIEPTDRLVNTSQVLRHAAPVRVWRSRVYRASEVA